MYLSRQQAADENTPPEQLRILVNPFQDMEILRLVAPHSSAEPELLRELASYGDKTICQAVVSNPNTPTDVLFALGAKFPGQLLENPVFSLLLLEGSKFFSRDTLQNTK